MSIPEIILLFVLIIWAGELIVSVPVAIILLFSSEKEEKKQKKEGHQALPQ